jgi:cytochrome c-type biogenesis protein CcmH
VRPVAIAVLALALAAAAPVDVRSASGVNPADLEAELVCPTCDTTLDQSNSPIAQRMKAYIRGRVAEGATAEQIKAELVDEFGRGVLATPPREGFDLLAWLLPLAGLALGAVVVAGLAWSWSRRRPAAHDTERPLDPEQERRLDEELARFDA